MDDVEYPLHITCRHTSGSWTSTKTFSISVACREGMGEQRLSCPNCGNDLLVRLLQKGRPERRRSTWRLAGCLGLCCIVVFCGVALGIREMQAGEREIGGWGIAVLAGAPAIVVLGLLGFELLAKMKVDIQHKGPGWRRGDHSWTIAESD